ncbi:conserved hypothetical protein [Streptomyces albidoflavus]|nr:conserved hypothetical protein [Streptomyces albidoflavus]
MRQDPLGSPGPLPRLAAEVRAARPSLGPVRLIAVDGHAGSGKTTFAGQLAGALGGAPVLHLDDLATHEEPFAWTARLREQVLAPLGRGEEARYRPYDWHRRAFGPPRPLPAAPVVCSKGWARAAARCGRYWPGCCGWRSTPGPRTGGARRGTGRNRRPSGAGGSRPSDGTSPPTPRGPSPTRWCGPARPDRRFFPAPVATAANPLLRDGG